MGDIKQPPPVAERPRCPNCDKPLRPIVYTDYGTKEVPVTSYRRVEVVPGAFRMEARPTGKTATVPGDVPLARRWTGEYAGYGAFCTLRCCESFANAAYRAGYRITKPKEA